MRTLNDSDMGASCLHETKAIFLRLGLKLPDVVDTRVSDQYGEIAPQVDTARSRMAVSGRGLVEKNGDAVEDALQAELEEGVEVEVVIVRDDPLEGRESAGGEDRA
jgi:hypothetical protein